MDEVAVGFRREGFSRWPGDQCVPEQPPVTAGWGDVTCFLKEHLIK